MNFVYDTGKGRKFSSSFVLPPLQGVAAFSWFSDGIQTWNVEDFSPLKKSSLVLLGTPEGFSIYGGFFFAWCSFFLTL